MAGQAAVSATLLGDLPDKKGAALWPSEERTFQAERTAKVIQVLSRKQSGVS